MRNGLLTGVETIKFQNGLAFDALVECYKAIRNRWEEEIKNGNSKTILNKKTHFNYEDDSSEHHQEVIDLVDVIKKYFGIKIANITNGEFAVYVINISSNDILISDYFKDIMEASDVDLSVTMKKVLSKLGQKVLHGTIDLKNSKVSGVFSEIPVHMLLPFQYLGDAEDRLKLTDEEYAAITLHEIGHVFTQFEYLDRTMVTNQVLAANAVVLNHKDATAEEKKIVFSKSIKLIEASEKYISDLEKAKSDTEITIIYLDAARERANSQMELASYTTISSEQLADQFAIRHGAGKHLGSGLNKLIMSGKLSTAHMVAANSLLYIIIALYGSVLGIVGAIAAPLLFIALLVSVNSNEAYVYDDNFTRFKRMKHDLINSIKFNNFSDKDAKKLLEDIEIIENYMNQHKDTLGFYDAISYLLKPSFRRNHDYAALQKKLEVMSANDLFVQAVKLKTSHTTG